MANTLTITETILKRDVGFVPFDNSVRTFEDAQEALAAFESAVLIWGDGAELVERDGNTVEFLIGDYHRVLIDLS